MSLLAKLSPKKATPIDSHSARLAAISKLDADILAAIGIAEKSGVAVHTILETLERFEQSQRFRLAASHRF